MNTTWTCNFCKRTERTSPHVKALAHVHGNQQIELIGEPIKRKNKKRRTYTKCAYCGGKVRIYPRHKDEFSGANWEKRFCSREHHVLFLKEKAFHKHCVVCGMIFYCQPSQIKFRNRSTCSRKCQGIMQTRRAEERREKDGLTKHQIDRGLRYSKMAKDWRTAVFERDNYTCQECHARGGRLEAHHIKPFGFFPEHRFDINNGLTLCRDCHNKTKTDFQRMRLIYGTKKEAAA
jgi:5-methylcytosine-specific restriction endonuclease McrA